MKKLTTVVLLAALLTGVYSCSEDEEPAVTSSPSVTDTTSNATDNNTDQSSSDSTAVVEDDDVNQTPSDTTPTDDTEVKDDEPKEVSIESFYGIWFNGSAYYYINDGYATYYDDQGLGKNKTVSLGEDDVLTMFSNRHSYEFIDGKLSLIDLRTGDTFADNWERYTDATWDEVITEQNLVYKFNSSVEGKDGETYEQYRDQYYRQYLKIGDDYLVSRYTRNDEYENEVTDKSGKVIQWKY